MNSNMGKPEKFGHLHLVYNFAIPFKMLGFTFSSKLDWGSYIISIANTASKEIGSLICFMDVNLSFYEFSFSRGCSVSL